MITKFPQINQSKVQFYYCIMALTIESYHNKTCGRKYYFVKYIDGSEMIFMTTNEIDSDHNDRILDEEFLLIFDFKDLIAGFENSRIFDYKVKTKFNSPPKYIYYDIVLIDDFLKPVLLKHLQENVSGFSELDLSKNETQRVNDWVYYLKS